MTRRATVAVIAGGLAVLIAAGTLGVRRVAQQRRAEAAFAVESGSLALPGIASRVEILRDVRGIPHIEAQRERDAWVVLGFVHAQDRLAQLLWMRRLARGQTAEVLGEGGLAMDRLVRTLGIGLAADAEATRLDPAVVEILEAYSAGINARVARIRSGLARPPLALAGRADEIEPWQPSDSIALLKLIAWCASNRIESGLVLSDLTERLGSQLARPFKPTGRGVQGVEVASGVAVEELDRLSRRPAIEPLMPPSMGLADAASIRGGTAWGISGRHTRSGAPILVADLHLPPTVPSLVHELHLRGGGIDVAGATIPGIPVVWAGRNLHVAWAASPARAVTVDLYEETVRYEDGRYRPNANTPDRWVRLKERRETILVRTDVGEMREEEWPIQSTLHGPLINPLLGPPESGRGEIEHTVASSQREQRAPLALSWPGTLPGNGIGSLIALARAANADEVTAALAEHHEPVLSVVFADDGGRVGTQLAGWLPRRALPTGLQPMPGGLRLFDWRGGVDYAALPARRIDGRHGDPGWVISADGTLDDGLTSAGIEWLWRNGERTRRLGALLVEHTAASADPLDLRAAALLQQDVTLVPVDELIPALLRLAQQGGGLRPEAREIAQLLGRWDGVQGADRRGAVAYQVLMEHLVSELFRAPFGNALYAQYRALPGVDLTSVVSHLIVAADRGDVPGGWTDPERVSDAIQSSLRKTWVSLSYRLGPNRADWSWGGVHRLAFRPFATDGGADSLRGLRPVGIGGDATTLAMASSEPGRDHRVAEASIYRIAVDLAAPDRMLSSLAPGQSEHPRHPHYADGLERWLDGRPGLLLTSRLLVEEELGSRLLLEPVGQ